MTDTEMTESTEPRLTKRQMKALETRERIIEASRKLITEKGFDNVSMEDIALEAGVSKGSFYTYFSHKEDIIRELNKNDFLKLAEKTIVMDTSLGNRLEFYCTEFLTAIERSGMEICRQWIRNNISPMGMEEIGNRTKYDYDLDAMLKILRDAVDRRELSDDAPIEKIAVQINAHLYGLMTVWCMSDGQVLGSRDVKDFCRTIASKVLVQWAVPSAQHRSAGAQCSRTSGK